ncbi:MAG: ABC-F family ATP-binding cassette domain-containing protein [Firmicutes bacterium]|nr:ABC-F family ATP-binding cassette domain-containing protein [Bacillota bacterium]
MSILNVENVSFSFGDGVLFKNISFRLLREEHVGLVGVNGSGKTTFLNILTGKLIPDKGNIKRPSSIEIGYLDQHAKLNDKETIKDVLKSAFSDLYIIEKEMITVGDKLSKCPIEKTEKLINKFERLQNKLVTEDFYSIDKQIKYVSKGLGLDVLGMDRPVKKLSGGQRTKVKLAKLLLKKSDLLLLDEPTNYLDKEHVDWLGEYLKNYPNSFIVISHDTKFLNEITNVIYNIEFSSMNRYPGNYNTFLKLKEKNKIEYIKKYHKQQKEIKRMEQFIKSNISRASTSKRAKSRQKKLNKIEKLEKPKTVCKPSFTFNKTRESSDLVFESFNMDIGYNYPILRNINLKLKRGDKIAITGCNGVGKSTLLKTIMGKLSPLSGNIILGKYLFPSYFEQEVKIGDKIPIQEVWDEFPKKNRKEIREALARCGLKEKHVHQKMSKLSGGEQSKVRLCKLMLKPCNWLLLDEPTNHLDVHAKEALKEELKSFKGTILIVSHEKSFYKDLVTDVWNMEKYSNEKLLKDLI